MAVSLETISAKLNSGLVSYCKSGVYSSARIRKWRPQLGLRHMADHSVSQVKSGQRRNGGQVKQRVQGIRGNAVAPR